MSAINFEQLFYTLKSGVESIAKDSLKDYESQAKEDGTQALDDVKLNLQQWVKELETGAINHDDFTYLLQEEKDLTKMIALKQAGLAQIRVDEFRNSIINLIVTTVTGLIKI